MTEREAFERIKDELPFESGVINEALSVVERACEKRIPKKPKCPAPPFFEWPMRKAPVGDWQNHCENCGQALDWEGYRDENQPRE